MSVHVRVGGANRRRGQASARSAMGLAALREQQSANWGGLTSSAHVMRLAWSLNELGEVQDDHKLT